MDDATQVELLDVVHTESPREIMISLMGHGKKFADRLTQIPTILLKDERNRVISIQTKLKTDFISKILKKEKETFPLFNLFMSLLDRLNLKLEKVLIYDLEDSYQSRLFISNEDGAENIEIDSEVEVGIIISLLADSPIYVKEKIMQEVSFDASRYI